MLKVLLNGDACYRCERSIFRLRPGSVLEALPQKVQYLMSTSGYAPIRRHPIAETAGAHKQSAESVLQKREVRASQVTYAQSRFWSGDQQLDRMASSSLIYPYQRQILSEEGTVVSS